jgi:hypothetical protein
MARIGRSRPVSNYRPLHALLAGPPPDADTGAGVDSASVVAVLTDVDTGAGVDTGQINQSGTDTGTGVDTATVIQAGSDTASGVADAGSVGVTVTDSEQLTTEDSATSPSGSDTGSFAESAGLLFVIEGSDTATGADSASVSQHITGADTATGTDTATVLVQSADTAVAKDNAPFLIINGRIIGPRVCLVAADVRKFKVPAEVRICKPRQVSRVYQVRPE